MTMPFSLRKRYSLTLLTGLFAFGNLLTGGTTTPYNANADSYTVLQNVQSNITYASVLDNDDGTGLNVVGFSGAATSGGLTTATNAPAGLRFVYDPRSVTDFIELDTGDSETDTFTYTILGNGGLASGGSATATVTITVDGVNDAVVLALSGTADATVNDKGEDTYKPFTGATITDPDTGETITLTVEIDAASEGIFTAGSTTGFTSPSSGQYVFSGTRAAAQTALRNLIFDPTQNLAAPGTTYEVTLDVTVTDDDGVAPAETPDVGSATITVTSINDAPTLVVGDATLAMTDKEELDVFSDGTGEGDFVLNDVDINDTYTVVITYDSTKGDFTSTTGFTAGGTTVATTLTRNGNLSTIQSAVDALTYDPIENLIATGTTDDHTFSMTFSDGDVTVNGSTTVTVTSVNDAPDLSPAGPFPIVSTAAGATYAAFDRIVLADPDYEALTDGGSGIEGGGGSDFTATITLTDNADSSTGTLGSIASSSFAETSSGSNVYTFEGKRPEVQDAIRAALYVAPSATGTFKIKLQVRDSSGDTSTQDSNVVVATTAVVQPTPGMTNLNQTQSVDDDSTITPFSGAVFNSFGVGSRRVEITLVAAAGETTPVTSSNDEKGVFDILGSFTKDTSSDPDVYSYTGNAINATSAIQALRFRPTENRIVGSSDIVAFRVRVLDVSAGTELSVDNLSLTVDAINDFPSINLLGFDNDYRIDDNETTKPYDQVTVADVDEGGNQSVTAVVTFVGEESGAPGTLYLSGVLQAVPYTITGTPSVVTAALKLLEFRPDPVRNAVGENEQVTFTLQVTDVVGASVVNSSRFVTVDAVNGAPQINGVPALSEQPYPVPASGERTIIPFIDLTVLDEEDLDFTITLDNDSKGTLNTDDFTFTPTSPVDPLNPDDGVYSMSGTPLEITTALHALVYTVDATYVFPEGGTGLTTFTLEAMDANNTTTVDFTLYLRERNVAHIVSTTDDSGTGSLREAIAFANTGDFIVFELASDDYPATIRLGSTLTIDTNLTIVGSGVDALTISGDSDGDGVGDVGIFSVVDGGSLTLERLTLANGAAPSYGGAIAVDMDGSITARDCSFEGNTAGQYGGAIDVFLGNMTIEQCLFYQNSIIGSQAQGGGAISVYTTGTATVKNSTFVENRRTNTSEDFGGGAIFAENGDLAQFFYLDVEHCTFLDNTDAGNNGGAILAKNSGLEVRVRNNIFAVSNIAGAPDDFPTLDVLNGGKFLSLGGNIVTDSTQTTFTQGGNQNVYLLDSSIDDLSVAYNSIGLLPLADNGGPTLTCGLSASSIAIDEALIVNPIADSLAIDQRGMWRDSAPDVGAFEANNFKRINMNELYVETTDSTDFIEFYVPRDSIELSVNGLVVWIDGVEVHTFSGEDSLPPAYALVYDDTVDVDGVNMDGEKGVIELKRANGQLLNRVSYMGAFAESGIKLDISGQSITRYPLYEGGFLPHLRAAQQFDSSSTLETSPGDDLNGVPFGGGNAVPIAVIDAEFDESATDYNPIFFVDANQTLTPNVLENDIEYDLQDLLKITEVMPINGGEVLNEELRDDTTSDGTFTLSELPIGVDTSVDPFDPTGTVTDPDVRVTISGEGQVITYDPRLSDIMIALSAGETITDIWAYTIADFSGDPLEQNPRGSEDPVDDVDHIANIKMATTYFTVVVTGVNNPPVAGDDSGAETEENQAIRFLVDDELLAPTPFDFGDLDANYGDFDSMGAAVVLKPELQTFSLLANDSDVDNDNDNDARDDTSGSEPTDGIATLEVVSVHTTDVTVVGQLTTVSELNATVKLDIRANRIETSIIYDPRSSTILNALQAGEQVTDSFYYTIRDLHGEPAVAKVSILVTGVNDIPTANDDPDFMTTEDVTLEITDSELLGNDTDPDQNGDPSMHDDVLTILNVPAMSDSGAILTLSLDKTGITYDPTGIDFYEDLARNEVIIDQFVYTISDDNDGEAQATAFIKLVGRNDRPTAENDLLEIDENQTVTVVAADGLIDNDDDIDINGTPPDDDPWVIPQRDITTGIGAAFYIETDGSYRYDANSAAIESLREGELYVETFPYILTDNSRMNASDDSFKLVWNSAEVTLPVLANDDVAGSLPVGVLGYTADSGNATRVVIESANHELRDGQYIKIENYEGGAAYNGVFAIAVIDRDHFSVEAPFVDTPATELGTWRPWFIITALGDPDNNGIVSISADQQSLLYFPRVNFYGTESFSYTIENGVGGQDVSVVEMLMIREPLNSDLCANDDSVRIYKDQGEQTIDVLANDNTLPRLGSNLVITQVSVDSAAGTIEIAPNQKSLIYKPVTPSAVGVDTFTYTVSGATNATSSAEATLTVTVIEPENFVTNAADEDDYFVVVVDSEDQVLDVLTNDETQPGYPVSLQLISVSTPTLGSATVDGNVILYSAPSATGTDTFDYVLEDEFGLQTTKSVEIELVADASNFYAVRDEYIVWAGSPEVIFPVLSNDLATGTNSDEFSVVNLGLYTQAPPAPERVAFTADGVNFTPPDTAGEEVFTYEISDGTLARREAEIRVTVIDDYPELDASDDAYCVAKNSSAQTLDVLGNDATFPLAGWQQLITAVSAPNQGGTVEINAASTLRYTPAEGFFGVESFTYTVSDLYGQTDTATVTIRVGSLTTAPDAYVVLEDSEDNAMPVLLNDDWLNRFAADYEISAVSVGNRGGTITIDGVGPNNQILYSPAADFFGVETFTYTVTDLTGNTAEETVTVEVISEVSDRAFAELRIELTGVNDSPVLGGTENDSITDKESTFPFDTVTLSDVDEDGDQEQTVTVEFDASLGSITFSATAPAFVELAPGQYQVVGTPAQVVAALRSIEFTPFENIRPPVYYDAVFTLTIDDGYLATPIVDLTTVTILAINDAPTGVDDAYTTEENQAIRLLADATLLPSAPFDFGDLDPDWQEFDATGVQVTLLPELQTPHMLANDFDVDIDDDNTTIEIINVHTTDARVDQITTTSELGAIVVLDIRFDRAETSVVYDPRSSAILNALSAGETIEDTFYYTVLDKHGAVDQAKVTITVVGVNDVPTANNDSGYEGNEDGTVTLSAADLLYNDTDPDLDDNGPNDMPVISSVPTNSVLGANLIWTYGSSDIVYDPAGMVFYESLARNEFITDSITYTISDLNGGTSMATIELVIEGLNDAPIADDDRLDIDENDTQSRTRATGLISNDFDIDINGTTPDDDPWIIPQRQITTPIGAALTIETDGSYTYDANSRDIDSLFEGELYDESFPYIIIDNSRLNSSADSFKVRTNSTDVVLPVLSNDDVAGSAPVGILGYAADGGDVNIVIIESANHELRDGLLIKVQDYQGAGAYNGVFPITVIDRDHFSIESPFVDDPIGARGTWRPWFKVTAVSLTDQDGVLAISADGQSIIYTPNADFYGTEFFEYTVEDGVGGQDVSLVELNVWNDPLNTVLSASDDRFQIGKGEISVQVDVLVNDNILPELGSALTVTSVAPVSGAIGTLDVINSGTALAYTPPSDSFVGIESFTYSVTGGGSSSTQATVTFEVIDREGFLSGSEDNFFVLEDSVGNLLDVAANDASLPSFPVSFDVVAVSTPSAGGSASVAGGQVSYTPLAAYTGPDTFTYTIRDASGSNVTIPVEVQVVPNVDEFYAMNDHYIIVAGSGDYDLPVLINDGATGANSTALVIEDLGLDTQAPPDVSRVDNTDTVVKYTAPATATTEVFTYEIKDGTSERREAVITVIVVDSLPTPTNPLDDFYHVAKNSSGHSLDVLLNDIPLPDAGWAWTISSVSTPSQGGSAVNNSGTDITYSPAAGFFGIETFTYEIVDAFGDSQSATVTVQVGLQLTEPDAYVVLENSAANDFPVLVNDDILEGFAADYTILSVGTPDQGGAVVIDGTGSNNQLLYAPAADFVGEETFTYTVVDNTGAISTDTVTVTVIDEDSDRGFAEFTVEITGINDLTMIANVSDGSTTDKLMVKPFPSVVVTDLDEDDLQLQQTTVSFDARYGTISAPGFTMISTGVYQMTDTPAAVTTALQAIEFTPYENLRVLLDYIAWGLDSSIGDVDFTLSIDDYNLSVSDSADAPVVAVATINIEPINDAPEQPILFDDIVLQVNSFPRGILLAPNYTDVDDVIADDELVWTVEGNSNTSLFNSVSVDASRQQLVLDFATDAFGVADITIRATDRGGLYVEDTFKVTIEGPPVVELAIGETQPDAAEFISGTRTEGNRRDYNQSFRVTNEGTLTASAFLVRVTGLDFPRPVEDERVTLINAQYSVDENGTLLNFGDDTRSASGVSILRVSLYEYAVKYDLPILPGESVVVHLTYRYRSDATTDLLRPDIEIELTTATPAGAGMVISSMDTMVNGEVGLEFAVEAGRSYQLEYTSDLGGVWIPWTLVIPVTEFDRTYQVIDDGLYTDPHPSTAPVRFYRLVDITAP